MRLPVNHRLAWAGLLLAGTAGIAMARPDDTAGPTSVPRGPAADYPVTVGEPFTIGSSTWTPANQLNYDAVGYATVGGASLVGVSGAHKTLPLPSYAEVTSLETGHTILVRLVERGPMVNETLISLSDAAVRQLGLPAGTRSAVRVRRVNPPEMERAALRTGGTAPVRMDTPESLLKVLRRKLAEQSPLMPPPSTPPQMPAIPPAGALTAVPASKVVDKPKASEPKAPTPKVVEAEPAKKLPAAPLPRKPAAPPASVPPAPAAPKPPKAPPVARTTNGSHVVQVAAFSTAERARKVAAQLGGQVSAAGTLWRVRLGPFAGIKDASPALEKAKAAGYRDARIQRAD